MVLRKPLWLILIVIGALLVISIAVSARTTPKNDVIQQPKAAPTNSTEAKISWSTSAISISLSPGGSASRNVSFTSSLSLSNVTIEAVPEITRFLTIQASVISNVPGTQLQSITLSFSIDPATALGTYQGTVHVRSGNQTFPQTLKLTINVAFATFNNPELGFQIAYPVGSTIVREGDTINFFDPNYPDLPPTFDIELFTPSVDTSKPPAEILEDIARKRLTEDFQGIISFSGSGVLVKAGTIYGEHFFVYDAVKNKAAEIRGGSPDFFSTPSFQYIRDSLVFF